MDIATTLITDTLAERAELIMTSEHARGRWQITVPASLAMINKRSFPSLSVDAELEASCPQGARLLVDTKQSKQQGINVPFIVMGGHYATDGNFRTRWGSSPGSPPV